MKKIFIAVFMILATIGATLEVEASNKTSRFRASGGRTSSYLKKVDKASSAIKNKWSRRSYRKRGSRSMTSQKASNKNYNSRRTSKSSSRRSTRRSYSSVYSSKKITRGVRDQSSLKVFSATQVPFTVLLPSNFTLLEDNLNRTEGSLKLRRGNVIVEILATEDRCEGGDTFVRNCLQQKSDTYLREFKKNLPPLELNKNESISLDPDNVQLTSKNRGWFVELSSLNYKAGQLTFFDSVNEFIWLMRITSAGKGKSVLDDNKVLHQVFSSLLVLDPVKEKVQRNLSKIVTGRRSTVGTKPRTKNPVVFGGSEILRFKAEKVPFEMELPNTFALVSDTLDWSEGTALFESEDGSIELTATSNVCAYQTSRLKRRCMEKESAKFALEIKKEFLGGIVLQDDNMQIQLEDVANTKGNLRRTSMTKSHLGRLFIMRMNGTRIGTFTFVDPHKNFVWKMRIEVLEGLDSLLSNVRQKKKVFSSLLFKAEEE